MVLEHILEISTGWRQTSWLFTRLAEKGGDELRTIENTMAPASWSEKDLNRQSPDFEPCVLTTLPLVIITTCKIHLLYNVFS